MLKHISNTIARTALIASFGILSITAAQAAEMPSEIGHINWNWWQVSSAPHTTGSTSFTAAAHNSEIGYTGWDWWSHNVHFNGNTQSSLPFSEMTPEIGHVSWQWWKEKTST